MYTVYKYKNVKISSSEQSKWVPLHGGGSSSRSRRCRYGVCGMGGGRRKGRGEEERTTESRSAMDDGAGRLLMLQCEMGGWTY